MAVRFQQRVQLFPGVRLNFSGGGLSVTLGVPGASVNLGPHGTALNLGIPGTGLSYRHRLGGSPEPTTHPGSDGDGVPPTPPLPALRPSIVPPGTEEIRSAAVDRLTSPDLAGLKRLLSEATTTRERLARKAADAVRTRDEAWRQFQRVSKFPLSLVSKGRLPALRAAYEATEEALADKVAEHDSCQVAVDFAFDEAAMEAWRALTAAHDCLSRCSVIWDVTTEVMVDRVKTRSAAGKAIDRRPVRFGRGGAPIVATRWTGLRIGNANGEDLELFPGFCLVRQRQGTDFALLDLREAEVRAWPARFVEEERMPPDAQIVDTTWAKVNKDGSRDRRFADNRQIPVALYGYLTFTSRTGLREEYLASSVEAAEAFGSAYAGLQRALEDLARRSRSGDVEGAPAWAGGPEGVPPDDRYRVPPLPEVGGAHGYTVAALGVAATAVFFVAGGTGLLPRLDNPVPAPQAMMPQPTLTGAAAIPQPAPAVASPAPAPAAPVPSEAIERVVTRSAANVRATPNGEGAVVRTAPAGTALRVHGRSGGWVRVGDTQPWGWIHGSLLAPVP
ncbi:DUF4236 domain-containing protein (plasmid) [Roseomonas sp. OT10]|uniref:DUF4236 domain-containing protein n=1 Tax=Roseomonas cutis TaxID=2897332 RepID=UPI001E3E95DC|nr:DUF4236 domain-containing protein [Roseomonas sp. OT10]UFN51664.1 DUF4236 domain-containing protein [Roseomonas sp. OT10]